MTMMHAPLTLVTETGCSYTSIVCDDNDACNTDWCDDETTPVDCDDYISCTNDFCDSSSRCYYIEVICDDYDACTDDSCDTDSVCVTHLLIAMTMMHALQTLVMSLLDAVM